MSALTNLEQQEPNELVIRKQRPPRLPQGRGRVADSAICRSQRVNPHAQTMCIISDAVVVVKKTLNRLPGIVSVDIRGSDDVSHSHNSNHGHYASNKDCSASWQ